MRTLFLDLGSNKGSIACVDGSSVLHLATVDHRIDDASLTGLIEQTIKDAGWSYADLTNIACVVGPGGFTSLRVGVATANALADALGIPQTGIHLSDLYQARSPEKREQRKEKSVLFWLHSTKKNELFIRSAGNLEPGHIMVDELPTHLKKGGQWVGELIPEHRAIVEQAGMKEASLRPLEEVLAGFLAAQEYKKRILQPWYGRGW